MNIAKLDESYMDFPEFSESGKVSLFKKMNYQVSVSIELYSSQMGPNVCK